MNLFCRFRQIIDQAIFSCLGLAWPPLRWAHSPQSSWDEAVYQTQHSFGDPVFWFSVCVIWWVYARCLNNNTTFSIQKCSGSSFNWGTQFPKLPRKFRAGFEIQSMKVALILIPIDSGQHLNGMRNTKWSRTLKWSWSWLLLQCGSGFLDWVHVYSILSWFEIVYKSCIQKDVYWELMSKFTPWIIPVISTSLLVAWKESIWRIN